uniref:THUMP domain containing 2 n=1 Tax=Gasterosteus aculeatus aculeatus TaxID=481459 RepID=A0AAQ4S000_GASAC
MSEPESTGSLVRYYCTAGNGMQRFLIAEVKKKLAAEDVCQLAGKVLFSSSVAINRVSELKAAERLFLLLRRDSPVRLSAHAGPAASVLQSKVLGDVAQWAGAAGTWSRLQGELSARRATGHGKEEEQGGGREEESSGGTGGGEARRLKRKRDEDEEEEKQTNPERKTDDAKEDYGPRPSRTEPEPPAPAPPTFRVSCKCTGSLTRYFSTQEVSRVIGGGLSRVLGWKADLKNPQLEVNVSLSDDHFLLGFPLTRLPLATRSYMKTTGLRSTVAWALASLAQIQPGSRVLDPMCGVGTVLIEAAQEHEAVCFLGVDNDDGQLQRANENVALAELPHRIQLLKASSMMLPLPSSSVDAVVCDLPFGRKFSTKTNMAANLPLILAEMERVLRVGGTLVLLLTPQLSCLLKKLLPQKDAGPTCNQEAEPATGKQRRPTPPASSTQQQTVPIPGGVKPPPTQETASGLQYGPPPPRCSMEHQETLRVSLGAIDGLIHKYVKTDS